MSTRLEGTGWVRIAGNSANIKEATPPYWRFSVGTDAVYPIDQWNLHGVASGTNMQEGTEPKGVFRLWVQAYGQYRLERIGDKDILNVTLLPAPEASLLKQADPSVRYQGNIKIFAAPDLMNNEAVKGRWRCVFKDHEIVLEYWNVFGNVTNENFHLEENVSSQDDVTERQIWLQVSGSIAIDTEGNARIDV